MYGNLLILDTLIAPLDGQTLVHVIQPMHFLSLTTMALPPTTERGRISPYFMASVGQTREQ